MTDFTNEFIAAMRAQGFEPKGAIIADDKWHQASAPGDAKNWYSGTYSMKIVSDDFAIGTFFSRRDQDVKHKWHSKTKGEKITPEEKKRRKKEIEDQQRKKEIEENKRYVRISDRLSRVVKSLPKATDDHPYLKRKGIGAEGLKLRTKGNELIMPLYGADGRIWTLQRITPTGRKFLFTGARKSGSYLPLASSKTDDLSLFAVTEGYATGKAVRDATRLPTIIAIDSGNLKAVLIALRSKYPNAKFIICADNDLFTFKKVPDGIEKDKVSGDDPRWEEWRLRDMLQNPGLSSAHKAATAIGGAYVVHPVFDDLKNKPTDFDDLRLAKGSDEVRAQIMAIVDQVPATSQGEGSGGDESQPALNQHPAAEPFERDYEAEILNTDLMEGDFGMNFKILGYNKGLYYYFPFRERQIVALTASAHTLPNLFRLDDLDNWMQQFGAGGDTSEKKVVMYANNALMNVAKGRGIFKEEDRVRGCGAWIDAGRKVLHCGNILYVDGYETKFDQLSSEYTYIAASKLMKPAINSLSDREAYALRKICEAVTWENKLSGSLLAGWLVIAAICGALDFRPHIYITGEAESGKSTVLNRIIKPVLGRMSINVDGGTTEPAIREIMDYDARPLVYDEAEKSNQMPSVIDLARKASTGSVVKKFGQKPFNARFCACFSAINPPVNKMADESRIAFMVIKKNRKPTAIEDFEKLIEMIEETLTPDYSARLIARTMENFDALFDNIKTFKKAARKVIRGARASEVIGTMLAGLYLLSSTKTITLEAAEEWIAEHDWTNHTAIDDDADPVRLLQYLSSSILRYAAPGYNAKEVSIGDLIVMAYSGDDTADKLLRYNGIAVKDGRVYIASRSQNLEKILRDTDWSMKWTRMLSNIDGAETFKIFYFGVAMKTSGVSLPINIFTDREPKQEAQPDLPMYEDQEISF